MDYIKISKSMKVTKKFYNFVKNISDKEKKYMHVVLDEIVDNIKKERD